MKYFFSEPILYVTLASVIISLGTWLAFVTGSAIPILVVAVPLGALLANVAEVELTSGRKWFLAIVFVAGLAGFWAWLYSYEEILHTTIFVLILVCCSLYLRKASYKKRGRK